MPVQTTKGNPRKGSASKGSTRSRTNARGKSSGKTSRRKRYTQAAQKGLVIGYQRGKDYVGTVKKNAPKLASAVAIAAGTAGSMALLSGYVQLKQEASGAEPTSRFAVNTLLVVGAAGSAFLLSPKMPSAALGLGFFAAGSLGLMIAGLMRSKDGNLPIVNALEARVDASARLRPKKTTTQTQEGYRRMAYGAAGVHGNRKTFGQMATGVNGTRLTFGEMASSAA